MYLESKPPDKSLLVIILEYLLRGFTKSLPKPLAHIVDPFDNSFVYFNAYLLKFSTNITEHANLK